MTFFAAIMYQEVSIYTGATFCNQTAESLLLLFRCSEGPEWSKWISLPFSDVPRVPDVQLTLEQAVQYKLQ